MLSFYAEIAARITEGNPFHTRDSEVIFTTHTSIGSHLPDSLSNAPSVATVFVTVIVTSIIYFKENVKYI